MRVLWIVNIVFPYPANKLGLQENIFGGWLMGLFNGLAEDQNLHLGIVSYHGNKSEHFKDSKADYYIMPRKSHDKDKLAENIIERFEPDIIHVHGTEFDYSAPFIKVAKQRGIPIATSIQGMVGPYSRVFYGNIPVKDILMNLSMKDIIRHSSIISQRKDFIKRSQTEKKILESSDFIIGRTTWDKTNAMAVCHSGKYYHHDATLRKAFYNQEWDIDNIERHSIFVSQAGYPIKGLHILLEAVSLLKERYPDIKLYIGGYNIVDSSSLMKKIKFSGYGRYIANLIKKYDLSQNVVFTGKLNENNMVDRLLKTHVNVVPSAIENESNSLCEGMLLGMPCVASYVGGMMDMLEDKKNGFLYPYTEPAMCAYYISMFFENDKLCRELGHEARIRALRRHDVVRNTKRGMEIYEEILQWDKTQHGEK